MPMGVTVRRVVPDAGEVAGRAVEDDPLAHEHEPLDDVLDGAELVRDVEDRDAELARAAPRAGRRARSCASTSTPVVGSSSTSSDGRGGERLGDERALLLPARELVQRPSRAVGEADALDRLGHRRAVLAAQPAVRPERRAAGLDDLAHRRRRVRADPRPLGEVADPRAVAERRGRARRRAARGRSRAARARARDAAASSCRRRSARRSRRTRPPRRRGRRRAAPAGRACRRSRRRRARPLAASERLPQRGEVAPHQREVVLAALGLVVGQPFDRVEHGRRRRRPRARASRRPWARRASRRTRSSHVVAADLRGELGEPAARSARPRARSRRSRSARRP